MKTKTCVRCFKQPAIEGSHYCQKCIVDFMLERPSKKLIDYYKVEKHRLENNLQQKLAEVKWLRENLKEVKVILDDMQVQAD